jgi:hypothetical protein
VAAVAAPCVAAAMNILIPTATATTTGGGGVCQPDIIEVWKQLNTTSSRGLNYKKEENQLEAAIYVSSRLL